MLEEFFKLNGTPVEVATQVDLLKRLDSGVLRDVVYTGSELALPGAQSRLSHCQLSNCSFKRTTLTGLVFAHCSFEDCLFLGVRFIDCEFHDCTFTCCNLHHSTFQGTYIDPALFVGAFDRRKHSNVGVWVFQALMRNAEQTSQKQFAATAEYNFRKWKRYQINWEFRTKRTGFARWARFWFADMVFLVFAGYGLRARFIVCWAIVGITAAWIANLYWWPELGMLYHGVPKPSVTPIEALYFSVVTLTTLGYGDLTPTTPQGMLLSTAEVLAGVLLLGIFVAIAVRKVLR